ncbi:MAG TPA: hypothetical protein VIM89_22120 [Mucilaginibacter sp.]
MEQKPLPKTEIDFKIGHAKEWLDNERSLRRFMSGKYGFEILNMVVVFAGVLTARFLGFIDNCVTGTLLGTVIGYFCADIRKIHN